MPEALTFLIFKDQHAPEWWVAQCLEYDVATQARTLDGLKHAVRHLIDGHAAVSRKFGLEPFQGLDPAPEPYRRAFAKAHTIADFQALPEGPVRGVGETRVGDLVPA